MNISKTLFKALTRCSNAPALYNMYINKAFHDVKEINGVSLDTIRHNLNDLGESLFNEELYELEENIFTNMFDEETGEDLTIMTSAQLEAFKNVFTEVEVLATKHIEKMFNKKVIASKNTYEQKKYEFYNAGNKYYCYLDAYLEDNKKIKVFEVKSTSSRRFSLFTLSFKRGGMKLPIFEEKENGIFEYIADRYIGQVVDDILITKDLLNEKLINLINRYSDIGKYIYDISIERNVIEHSYLSKNEELPEIDYYLVILNHEYIYDGALENDKPIYLRSSNGQELFKIYSVNELTKLYQPLIDEEREKLEEEFIHLTVCNNCLGKHCMYKKTEQCKFFNICHQPVLIDGSILDYTGKDKAFKELGDNPKKRKVISMYDLINNGIYTMEGARNYITGLNQQIELDCYLNNKTYYDIDNLTFLIDKITYPIYHLDFESYNCPLPRFYGEKPYTQSLFQYSLHIEKEPGVCDIEKDHYEYLAPDHLDRRRCLAEKLISDIDLSNGGCVLAYHADFEKRRIKELMVLFKDLEEKLLNIYEHVFDLEHVIHASIDVYKKYDSTYTLKNKPTFNFYHKDLHGSFSIKKILPLFTDLSYNTLDVKNGTEAVLVYGMLPMLSEKEYEDKYLALRRYCRQDTWSMVKILQGIKNAINYKDKK